MSGGDLFPSGIARLRRRSFVAGLVALAVCGIAAIAAPAQFFRSYLVAYLFWSGICLGSLAVLMLHHLTGGAWGLLIRRPLEAATRTMPLVAVLVVPIFVGIPELYAWSHAASVAADPALQHKSAYLNVPFFIARTASYFIIWIVLTSLMNRWSREQDRTGAPALARQLSNISGPGLVIYGLTVTFASLDWVMSLEPDWFSTIYSLLFMVGQVLAALAFVIALLGILVARSSLAALASPQHMGDLGNLLLTFVILWAYMAYSQFLIIWSGNLTDEIPWYLRRLAGGWEWIALALIVLHFAVPFFALLSREVKRRAWVLSSLAGALLVLRFVDLYWTVDPAFDAGFRVHWLDLAAAVGIGGVWLAMFAHQLEARPLVPLHDPGLSDAVRSAREA
jgi:hypothetical protein